MRSLPFARFAASAILILTLALTCPGLLSAQTPNDPFLQEHPDFGPVNNPERYQTFQWHLGYQPLRSVQRYPCRRRVELQPRARMPGHLRRRDFPVDPTGSTMVVAPPHEDLAANFREHLSPAYGTDLLASKYSRRESIRSRDARDGTGGRPFEQRQGNLRRVQGVQHALR